MNIRRVSMLVLGFALALAACSKGEEAAPAPAATADGRLSVSDVSVRLSANAAAPSVAYFTINGGKEASTLVGVISADIERAELHESKVENGVTSMAAVDNVPVPAGGTVTFRQGGMHVMLFGVKDSARTADKINLTLLFEGGRNLAVEAPLTSVTGAGKGAAAETGHEHHW